MAQKANFVVWKRAINELHCCGTYAETVENAKDILETTGEDEVLILEVKKRVLRKQQPIVVVDP